MIPKHRQERFVNVSNRGAARWAAGHPWIYASDVVDAPEGAEAGAVLVRTGKRPIGWALYSPKSEIALRLVDREDPATLLVAGSRSSPRRRARHAAATDLGACSIWGVTAIAAGGRHLETMLSGIIQDAGGCVPASSSMAPVKVRNPGGHRTPAADQDHHCPAPVCRPWRVKRSRANAA